MSAPSAPWTDLGGGLAVRQSRAFWMNSIVLGSSEHAIVVDPGVLPSELDDLARAVAALRPRQITLFLTHAHWDHVLGRPWWPKASVVAHDRFAAEIRRDREKILREAEKLAGEHDERWSRGFEPFAPTQAVSGLHFTRIDPWRLVFRDAYGHSTSQLSLHLPDRRVLIAADMLSDIEPPILDGPPAIYRTTLDQLVPLAEGGAIETLIPGHGAIAHGREAVRERLATDLDYLTRLEKAASAARAAGLDDAAAAREMAGMSYTGKGAAYDTARFHLENVRQALAAAPAPTRPR